MCQHGFMRGTSMRGGDYLDHYALPDFHFHVIHAYATPRHAGVPLGKLDFLGTLPLR